MSFFYFTFQGVPVSPLIPSPPGADDFHIQFDPGGGMIHAVQWTQGGTPVGPPIHPTGPANDVHFFTGPIPPHVPDVLKGESPE